MAIEIVPYAAEHAAALQRFYQRLAAGGVDPEMRFPEVAGSDSGLPWRRAKYAADTSCDARRFPSAAKRTRWRITGYRFPKAW